LAKAPLFHLGIQILIGCRNDPHIDGNFFSASYMLDHALLQDAQYLGLGRRAQIADFIEEDRSAVGFLKLPDAPLDSGGNSFFNAE